MSILQIGLLVIGVLFGIVTCWSLLIGFAVADTFDDVSSSQAGRVLMGCLATFIGTWLITCMAPFLVINNLKYKIFPSAPAPIQLLGNPEQIQLYPLEASGKTRSAYPSSSERRNGEPMLKTLRLTIYREDEKLRLRIRYLLYNSTPEEVVLDDMHAIIYERQIRDAPVLMIGYGGELKLLEDNIILKEERTYSLVPGDGYEFDLVLSMTVSSDAARVLFGVILDYYTINPLSDITRRTVTSDCIYLFRCGRVTSFPKRADSKLHAKKESALFTAIDNAFVKNLEEGYRRKEDFLQFVRKLESTLNQHLSYRPTPYP